jgi:vacuolar-type H+-ATPase subunit F/Vma7
VTAVARVAVIGESSRVQGYALAGALVCPAEDEAEVRAAWRSLPAECEVVIVTARAAAWLGGDLITRPDSLPVVMPG